MKSVLVSFVALEIHISHIISEGGYNGFILRVL